MVYYGAVSKGCQRCRQRKIKCDQRKPGCLKCEKAKTTCPGFRNLTDVVFRDESQRIIQRARRVHGETQNDQHMSPRKADASCSISTLPVISTRTSLTTIPYPLSQSNIDAGVGFFFGKYTCNEPPFSEAYTTWLTKMYWNEPANHALRATIEATGMAGISNVYYTPSTESEAKERYVRALAATKLALSDPIESVSDATLVTVVLLGLYEFLTFSSRENCHSWAAHIEGATALLQLQGKEQFESELRRQIFIQLRYQTLFLCMQHDLTAPHGLLSISDQYLQSDIRARARELRPGPLGDICFRLVDLRAALKSGEMSDREIIYKTAIKMDTDLETWRRGLSPTFEYSTIDAGEAPTELCYEGKCHLYRNPWTAQSWNTWRFLRIQANQIIRDTKISTDTEAANYELPCLSIIKELSKEICESVSSFGGSTRSATLIRPLVVVAQESSNTLTLRRWAIKQLYRIGSSSGIRQSGLLADTIVQTLGKSTA